MVEEAREKRLMAEALYGRQRFLGERYHSEPATSLVRHGYGIEKIHAEWRFEIAGVPRRFNRFLDFLATTDAKGDGTIRQNAFGRIVRQEGHAASEI